MCDLFSQNWLSCKWGLARMDELWKKNSLIIRPCSFYYKWVLWLTLLIWGLILSAATPVIGLLVSNAFLSSWRTNMEQIKERQTKKFLQTCTFEELFLKTPNSDASLLLVWRLPWQAMTRALPVPLIVLHLIKRIVRPKLKRQLYDSGKFLQPVNQLAILAIANSHTASG